jgi:aspartate/methionine/tyrosine aminotransferase
MTEILSAKPKLQPNFIDVSVGEPYLIKKALFDIFNLNEDINQVPVNLTDFQYPNPTGYQPLVSLLEEYHGAPVVITNGAKQGLAAAFHSLFKMRKRSISMRRPYWALVPQLAHMHQLECVYDDSAEAELCIAPNNPDGFVPNLLELENKFKQNHKLFIHDAAYYTPSYMDHNIPIRLVGDVQIFSISKMLGLSGLRLGYAVCQNQEMYKHISQYVEATTVGASIYSQIFLYNFLNNKYFKSVSSRKEFEDRCFHNLKINKNLCKGLDPEVLDVPHNIEDISGMFGWFKIGNKLDLNKSKIHAIEGSVFGKPGFIRMNLAFDPNKMQEIIKKLNQ